jgi:glycosyltransferase involved in cell wall biosynthesis
MVDDPGTFIERESPTIRVLIIAPSLAMIGGQSVQGALLLQYLADQPGLQVSFQPINPAFTGLLGSLQRVRYLRTLVNFPAYVFQLFRSISANDVIHIFSASYLSFVISQTPAILIARVLRKPILLNYHSGEAADHFRNWPSAVKTLRLVQKIIVPSEYLVKVFQDFGLPAEAIANVVDLTAFRFDPRVQPRLRFLANRNFEAHYNVACVLRTFARIQSVFPEAELTVAGDGPERVALHALADELQLKNVRFLGRVQPDSMPALYKDHDVWLNASNVDNMPLSILECFASGVVVVSTDAGGIPYMVTNVNTGMLVPCNDDAALANAALTVVRDVQLFRQLKQSALRECGKYSWDAVRSSWENNYWLLARSSRLLDSV